MRVSWLVWVKINVLILSDLRSFEKTHQSRVFPSTLLDQPHHDIAPGLRGGFECIAAGMDEIATISVETVKASTIVFTLLGLVPYVDLMIFQELV